MREVVQKGESFTWCGLAPGTVGGGEHKCGDWWGLATGHLNDTETDWNDLLTRSTIAGVASTGISSIPKFGTPTSAASTTSLASQRLDVGKYLSSDVTSFLNTGATAVGTNYAIDYAIDAWPLSGEND